MSLSDKFSFKVFREKRGRKWKNITHDEYHDKKARQCGCGIDCCNKIFVMHNYTQKITMYGVLEGAAGAEAIKWRNKADMKTAYPDMNL